MLPDPNQRWSLDGLAEAAGAVVNMLPRPLDQRVNPVPDVRTLRYYQSVGLLDRPDNALPRAEYYGYRHLLQVVATKALQASGLPLAQIQRGLAGRTVQELEEAIRSAFGEESAAPRSHGPASQAPPAHWRPMEAPRPAHPPVRMVTVELAPGLLVTIDPARHNVAFILDALSRSLHPGKSP
ncbi:MAG: MerR family transcriptional regulator [Myxococcales bacterium]|nr:MerR family transcriptional regulator [Myxococcales bacterium]